MNTTLHVTVDKEMKKRAAKLAKEMGLDLSSVVKASLNTFVDTQVFHVEKSYRVTPYLEKIITRARDDYKRRKNVSPVFDNAKDAVRWLQKNR